MNDSPPPSFQGFEIAYGLGQLKLSERKFLSRYGYILGVFGRDHQKYPVIGPAFMKLSSRMQIPRSEAERDRRFCRTAYRRLKAPQHFSQGLPIG